MSPGKPVEVGQRFSRGVVLVPDAGRNQFRSPLTTLRCDCGTEYTTARKNLWSSGTKSCGCLKLERVSETTTQRNWKGDDAGYHAKHDRIAKARGSADSCIWSCDHTHYEWAHRLGEIGPPSEYFAACVPCHRRMDAAIRKMQQPGIKDQYGHYWKPWLAAQRA